MTKSDSSKGTPRRRRLGAWGFEGESLSPSKSMLSWLQERLGETIPFPGCSLDRLEPRPPRALPRLSGSISQEGLDRWAHARGQGLPDLIRLRSGAVPALPDAVVQPVDIGEVETTLRTCSEAQIRVIPWGGGTSVTGGVNVLADDRPAITLDLHRLRGLETLDSASGLATFGAGSTGPEIEGALAASGWTLGHFPQSWELSTLGGWIATRASGQESLGYGNIADMVAGLELVTPAGRLTLLPHPSSAAGPDLRQFVLGSEGRYGIITRATVRLRPRPRELRITAHLLPTWEEALQATRLLIQERVPLDLLRLSDEPETEVALATGLTKFPWASGLLEGWLRMKGFRRSGCLLLTGASGDVDDVWRSLNACRRRLRPFRPMGLGRSPGRHWLTDRFRHPYLRDTLLDRGIATDTLETAAPWSRVAQVSAAVRQALEDALLPEEERTAVLCHLSHPYPDGASLYFTFFFRCPPDPDAAIHRWAQLKRAATETLVREGAALSHHHGVGSWHAPWLEAETGALGHELLRDLSSRLDPAGILNPRALLDPTDRLEE